MRRYIIAMALCASVFPAGVQAQEEIRRATISGSRGSSGKCTIEVRVDMSAEVDVYGDSGRLRTIAGQPATWTRMQCTDPLPYNMSNFRFKGIDGRGSVKLVQDPRNNNGMAVIRIDDPKSGSEGYTFDLEWSGASGGAPTNGFSTSGTTGNTRVFLPGRGGTRTLSVERAIDLCRSEVRARGERDYGLRNIDITAAAADTNQGRRNWITGAFIDRGAAFGRGLSRYRFNCAVDYASGQVQSVEILRADGSAIQPGAVVNQGSYNQNQALRACQDAVAARSNRDGYQNPSFRSTAIDTQRSGWISGVITASRGPVTDTFDFGCSMDFRTGQVRNVELKRR